MPHRHPWTAVVHLHSPFGENTTSYVKPYSKVNAWLQLTVGITLKGLWRCTTAVQGCRCGI